MKGAGSRLLLLSSAFSFAVLYAPVVVTVLFSFNAPRGRFNLQWQGFTLTNWLHPLRDAALSQAFLSSLVLALAAALIATLLGGLMALALSRFRLRGRRGLELLLVMPLTNPEIVLAASLLSLFAAAGVPRGPLTLLLAHSLFCLSYAGLTVKARLAGFDWQLEEAALDLGARPLAAFRRVTLPLLAPGLLAAAGAAACPPPSFARDTGRSPRRCCAASAGAAAALALPRLTPRRGSRRRRPTRSRWRSAPRRRRAAAAPAAAPLLPTPPPR